MIISKNKVNKATVSFFAYVDSTDFTAFGFAFFDQATMPGSFHAVM